MRIYRVKNYDAMSRQAANIISAQIILKPDSVLGLATGSTPIGAYRQLIDRYRMGDLDFSGIRSVNLDEYLGLSADDPRSYACFMRKNLFDTINIKPENTFIPDGCATDPTEECARYNQLIRALGGIDLQLLGIGNNGHIGFNEPGDCFAKETHPGPADGKHHCRERALFLLCGGSAKIRNLDRDQKYHAGKTHPAHCFRFRQSRSAFLNDLRSDHPGGSRLHLTAA